MGMIESGVRKGGRRRTPPPREGREKEDQGLKEKWGRGSTSGASLPSSGLCTVGAGG